MHWEVIPKTELQCWTETTKHPLTIRSVISNDVGFCKIGMELVDLVGDQHEQSEFFNLDHEWPQINRCLNQRFGSDTVFIAAQGIFQKWSMRRQMLTPQYTTRWVDLPKIRC